MSLILCINCKAQLNIFIETMRYRFIIIIIIIFFDQPSLWTDDEAKFIVTVEPSRKQTNKQTNKCNFKRNSPGVNIKRSFRDSNAYFNLRSRLRARSSIVGTGNENRLHLFVNLQRLRLRETKQKDCLQANFPSKMLANKLPAALLGHLMSALPIFSKEMASREQ